MRNDCFTSQCDYGGISVAHLQRLIQVHLTLKLVLLHYYTYMTALRGRIPGSVLINSQHVDIHPDKPNTADQRGGGEDEEGRKTI